MHQTLIASSRLLAHSRFPITALALAAALWLPAHAATKAAAPLMQGGQVSITVDDVKAELARMPAAPRERMLSEPDMLRQLIGNLFLRRALAVEAGKAKMLKQADVQHKLAAMRESVLAEAYVARVSDAAAPNASAADQLAQTVYKAEPQRFEAPAQTRARHILIKGTEAESRIQAEKLLTELKAGANFDELAKAHSADPGSAAKGGDLGFFGKGQMVKPFEEAVDALQQPGDLSGVVQSNFGYHIIRLDERRPAGIQPFEEVRDALRAEVIGKAQQEARIKEANRLRTQAKGDEEALQAFIAAQKKAWPTAAPAATAATTK